MGKVLVVGKIKEEILFVTKSSIDKNAIFDWVIWDEKGGPDKILDLDLLSYDLIVVVDRYGSYEVELPIIFRKITNEKICVISFFKMYHLTMPYNIVDRKMYTVKDGYYTGIIMGISHSEVGIIPRYLRGNVCNLAVSSQDLYYNLKSLEQCIDKYSTKIKNLEYVIFDMFDYTYFNFDTSLSKNIVGYLLCSGKVDDEHNYKNNTVTTRDFKNFDELSNAVLYRRFNGVENNQINWWEELFGNVHALDDYDDVRNSMAQISLHDRNKIVTDQDLEEWSDSVSTIRKVHEKTIKENQEYFERILQLLYQINPKLQVHLVIMPQFHLANKKIEESMNVWKERFYGFIYEKNKIYDYRFWDLKEHPISMERECWQDCSHLNYYGAVKFTRILNECLWNQD